MKTCTLCKVSKPLDDFSPRKGSKDGKCGRCKICHNETMRNVYRSDPKSKLADCRRRKQILLDIVNGIKAKDGCKLCKENDPVCLDFHHLDPSKKDLSVSTFVLNKSRQKMLDEIEKCVVVCANCHRKLHAGKIVLPTDVVVA